MVVEGNMTVNTLFVFGDRESGGSIMDNWVPGREGSDLIPVPARQAFLRTA
jgi:hypothetical protein